LLEDHLDGDTAADGGRISAGDEQALRPRRRILVFGEVTTLHQVQFETRHRGPPLGVVSGGGVWWRPGWARASSVAGRSRGSFRSRGRPAHGCARPSVATTVARALTSRGTITLATVDGTAVLGLEGDARRGATGGAHRVVHLTLRAAAAVAVGFVAAVS